MKDKNYVSKKFKAEKAKKPKETSVKAEPVPASKLPNFPVLMQTEYQ